MSEKSQDKIQDGPKQSSDNKELARITKEFGGITTQETAETAAIAVAAASKAEVESAYIMAMHHPRNEEDARTKIKQSCMNLNFAKKALYRKPVAKIKVDNRWVDKYVVGPSIRFAEEMARRWGNVKTMQAVIFESLIKRIVKITVIDLETNISYSKDVTVEKIVERKNAYSREVLGERINSRGEKVYIVVATEDEIIKKEAALASKTIRNNSLRLIPQHIIDESVEIINNTIKNGVSKDPQSAIRELMDEFAMFGIQPSAVEQEVGHPVGQLTPTEIADLQGVLNGIRDGQFTWAEYISDKPEDHPKPESGDLSGLQPSQDATSDVTKPIDSAPISEHQKKAMLAIQKKNKEDILKPFLIKFNKSSIDEFTHKEAEETLVEIQKKI